MNGFQMDRVPRSVSLVARGLVMALVALGWAGVAGAQTQTPAYPKRVHPFVIDFAMVIPEPEEQAIVAQLESLRAETGVEMVVVSLNGIPGGEAQLEAYATGLFNAWGIGDAKKNNGVLLLLSPGDQAVRLELGRAYGQGYDVLAQDIVSLALVPALREGRYPEGVGEGIDLVRKEIALPFSADGSGESPRTLNWMSYGVPALMVFAFGAIVWRKRRGMTGPRACPRCGAALATDTLSMRQSRMVHCVSCGWTGSALADARPERPDPTRDHRADAEGGSGGGSSSGGGASGRW